MTQDRDERIRQRAYEIWEREGRPAGKHDEHWQRAVDEVDEEERRAGSALADAARSIKEYATKVVTAGLNAAADVVEGTVKRKRGGRKTEAPEGQAAEAKGTGRRASKAGPAPEQVQSETPETEYEAATLAVAPEPPKTKGRRKEASPGTGKTEAGRTAAVTPTPEAAAPTATRRKSATAKPTMTEAKAVPTGASAGRTSQPGGTSKGRSAKAGGAEGKGGESGTKGSKAGSTLH